MQELAILKTFKNKSNYKNPCNPVVLGIINYEINPNRIINELYEMLLDNFSKTEAILGEELTNIVLLQKFYSKPI
jgi:hypothetical protein